MRTKLFLGMVLSVLTFAGCSSGTDTTTQTDTATDTSTDVSAPTGPTAAELHASIDSSLHQQFRGNTLSQVTFEVDASGVVTLSGTVASVADKNAVANAVAAIGGVSDLTNNLTVQASADLQGAVDSALHTQFKGDALGSVKATTDSSGTVTLSGTVATQADKDAIAKATAAVDGVANVVNKIAVGASSSTSTSTSTSVSGGASVKDSATGGIKGTVGY